MGNRCRSLRIRSCQPNTEKTHGAGCFSFTSIVPEAVRDPEVFDVSSQLQPNAWPSSPPSEATVTHFLPVCTTAAPWVLTEGWRVRRGRSLCSLSCSYSKLPSSISWPRCTPRAALDVPTNYVPLRATVQAQSVLNGPKLSSMSAIKMVLT